MITRDDWLNAVHEAQNAPLPESDALTVRELAETIFHCGLSAAQRRIDQLIAVGRAEQTTKSLRMKNGGVRTAAAYRLVEPGGSRDAQPTGHSGSH